MRLTKAIILLIFTAFIGMPRASFAQFKNQDSLAKFVNNKSPWLNQEAGSEQVPPYYLGLSPCEIALGNKPPKKIEISKKLLSLGKAQAKEIAQNLKLDSVEFEAWPTVDDIGRETWVFARYKTGDHWIWLQPENYPVYDDELAPLLPRKLDLKNKSNQKIVFDDFLDMDSLYDKPVFGNCLWVDAKSLDPISGWLPTEDRGKLRSQFVKEKRICYELSQPVRVNGQPETLIFKMVNRRLYTPTDLVTVSKPALSKKSLALSNKRLQAKVELPADAMEQYQDDVKTLAGEQKALFPISRRSLNFKRKNNADRRNQLDDMVEYFIERYNELGIKTKKQNFKWRGKKQTNLIAIIPGSLPPEQNRPVLMADHFDTAFSEDVYNETGKRVANPGADDNSTASAALLLAARSLKDAKPLHDIWLVHFTGEEFPADSLGARVFVSNLLKKKQKISGLVLLDMIGYNPKHEKLFQISAGDSEESLKIATLAQGMAHIVAPDLDPVIRSRFDERSYLYNTDGIIFSQSGFPVILLNEHLNYLENLDRRHYHESTDTSDKIDWPYAFGIVYTAIETVANMASSTTPAQAGGN